MEIRLRMNVTPVPQKKSIDYWLTQYSLIIMNVDDSYGFRYKNNV